MATIPLDEKFIGLSASVDTTQKRSELINEQSQAYTMQDIIDTVGGGPAYKVYSALITQTGTNAPVATILENTIGSIVWRYSQYAPGAYDIVGELPLGKSVVIAGPPNTYGPFAGVVLGTFAQVLANKIIIKSTNSSGVMQDGLLYNYFIEIRVYP